MLLRKEDIVNMTLHKKLSGSTEVGDIGVRASIQLGMSETK